LAEETGPDRRAIDRREALKRAAAVGVVAWAVPAVQTLNMREALASKGSPGEICYTVKIDYSCSSPGYGADVRLAYGCLSMHGSDLIVWGSGKCPYGLRWSKGNGSWYVTLPPGCRLVAGYAKSGDTCVAASQPSGSQGTIEFKKAKYAKSISNVQLTFCCPQKSGSGSTSGAPQPASR
jgi:hypothetical protein